MTTVMTFGVFDLLHVGHVAFLEQARGLGGRLVVGVPLDRVVEEDKGAPPVIPLADRMRMLAALRAVDSVMPYCRLEFVTTLRAVRPGILAVGEDWGGAGRHADAEEYVLGACGGAVVRLPRYPHESTTGIKRRVQGLLCHDSPEGDYLAFCDGCDDYQRKLFGRCRSDELRAALASRTGEATR